MHLKLNQAIFEKRKIEFFENILAALNQTFSTFSLLFLKIYIHVIKICRYRHPSIPLDKIYVHPSFR